jgi:hypothetical protein
MLTVSSVNSSPDTNSSACTGCSGEGMSRSRAEYSSSSSLTRMVFLVPTPATGLSTSG